MLIQPRILSLLQTRSKKRWAQKLETSHQNRWGHLHLDSQKVHYFYFFYQQSMMIEIVQMQRNIIEIISYICQFNYIDILCQLTKFLISHSRTMAELFNKLPQIVKNLVPEPNFNNLSLAQLHIQQPKNIINSIKTRTALSLLQPPRIYDPQPIITTNPIVLVFCQPSEQIIIQRDKIYPYTPVSYATWLEAAGAKCIPIPFNINEGSIQFLLQRSHGLLIPGGGSNLYKDFNEKEGQGSVMIGFLKIWRYIQKLWAKGIHFPIWGTCLGLEIMLLSLTGDVKILSKLNSRGHQIQIFSDYENSWMLNKLPVKLRLKSENRKLLNFQHSYGISVKKFLTSQKLVEKLKIVQISKDKDGKWFCSGLEGKTIPVFLSQYHPQKQGFQWSKTGQIRHNRDSIQLSQHLAYSFLNQCRKCKASKQFGSLTQQIFHSFHQYKQIHTPQKLYKVYAIDFKYREYDKEARKQLKTKRSASIAGKIKSN